MNKRSPILWSFIPTLYIGSQAFSQQSSPSKGAKAPAEAHTQATHATLQPLTHGHAHSLIVERVNQSTIHPAFPN